MNQRIRAAMLEDDTVKLFLVDHLIWLILAGTFLAFSIIIGPTFFSFTNLEFIVFSSVKLGFIVLAESIVLLGGNFDLSVGQLTGFAAMFNALLITTWVPGIPWFLAVITIIAFGGAMGSINGFFVGKLGINPFLFTLGTYLVFRGGTLSLSLNPVSEGFPETYLAIGGSSVSILLLLGAFLLFAFILHKMRLGSNIYSVGADIETAKTMGIDGGNVVFKTYLISGMLCGVAGLIFTGFVSSATPGLANNTLFTAFGAAVIGGISLEGGRGSIFGALGGTFLLGVISAGLTFMAIPPTQIMVVEGTVVILAILINRSRDNIRERILMSSIE